MEQQTSVLVGLDVAKMRHAVAVAEEGRSGEVRYMAEIGDLLRFDSPRQLMGYLGLVPAERSTGTSVRRLGITKADNRRVRQALIESAWCDRHPPRSGRAKHSVHERLPPAVRDSAATAQARLCARYRALAGGGRKLTVAVTAIARELSGFVWAIGREVQTA